MATYNTQFIAEFGKNNQDGTLEVNVRNAAETGAVRNRLEIRGSCFNYTSGRSPLVRINDQNVGPQSFARGLNLRVIRFDGEIPSVVDSRSYDLFGDTTNASQAMMDYLDSVSPGLIIAIVSHDAIRSTYALDAWMKKSGSVSWPGTDILGPYYRTAYCAIFISKERKFCMENVDVVASTVPAGIDQRPQLETVIDQIEDMGATGFNHLVYDGQTYEAGPGTFAIKYYPDNKVVLADVGIKAGDNLRIEWEQKTTKAGMDAGMKGMMSCSWFNSAGQWVTGERVYQTKPDEWERLEKVFTVPSNVTQFQAIFYRGDVDGNKSKAGVMSVRNFVVSQTTSKGASSKNAQLGLYGFKTNTITNNIADTAINRLLMQLPDPSTQPSLNHMVAFNNIGEKEKATVPLITKDK